METLRRNEFNACNHGTEKLGIGSYPGPRFWIMDGGVRKIGILVFLLHSFPPSSFPFPFLLSPFNPLELSNRRNLHLNLFSSGRSVGRSVNAKRRSVTSLVAPSFMYSIWINGISSAT